MARSLIPNSTQVPDVLLDYWMAHLSGSAFKVLLYIARRTYGFGKVGDAISLDQIMTGIVTRDGRRLDYGTGLSKDTVCSALKTLEKEALIVRTQRYDSIHGDLPTYYQINLDAERPQESGDAPSRSNMMKNASEAGAAEISAPPVQIFGQGGGTAKKPTRVSEHRDAPVSVAADAPVSVAADAPVSVAADAPVSPNSDTQEIRIQETGIQETATTPTRRPSPLTGSLASVAAVLPQVCSEDAATEALVTELVANNVNRKEALRLAREKPEECRRQLDCLPYQTGEFKSSKGAFLKSAIEDEYGAPKGYQEAQRRQKQALQTTNHNKLEAARTTHRARYENAYRTYVAEREEEIQEGDPASYAAFQEVEAANRKTLLCGPFAEKTGMLAEILAQHDSEDCYGKRLIAFFARHPENRVLPFWEWDAQRNAAPFQPPS